MSLLQYTKDLLNIPEALIFRKGKYPLKVGFQQRTKNRWLITRAVSGYGGPYAQAVISQNDNITEKQCRYLYGIFTRQGEDGWRGQLIRRTNFPVDILHTIAMNETFGWILEIVANHPNANEETKAILALRGIEN